MSDVSDKPTITCWRADGDDYEPVACQCEVFGWPNLTVDGQIMYQNTHFLSRKEAWRKIERNIEAHGRNVADRLEEAQAELAKRREDAAEFSLRYGRYLKARSRG